MVGPLERKISLPVSHRSFAMRAAIAVAIVCCAALVRFAFGPWIGTQAPFLLFTLAILASAVVTDPLAASVATLPALGFGVYFSDRQGPGSAHLLEIAFFLIVAAGIILLTHGLQR